MSFALLLLLLVSAFSQPKTFDFEKKIDEEFKKFDIVSKKGRLIRDELYNCMFEMMRKLHKYPSQDDVDL